MVTTYDIETLLYKALHDATQGLSPLLSISGAVYNGDRPMNSAKEDITVKTLSLAGDGFPQDAIVNVNAYVPDVAFSNGGYVRDGVRLSAISTSVLSLIESLAYDNASVMVESVAEIDEETIRQHYVNIRIRMMVYGNIN